MSAAFVPPLSHNLPCPHCGHDHSLLLCDWCLCNEGGDRIGIDTALGG